MEIFAIILIIDTVLHIILGVINRNLSRDNERKINEIVDMLKEVYKNENDWLKADFKADNAICLYRQQFGKSII